MKKIFGIVLVGCLLAACGNSESSLFRKAQRLTRKGEYSQAIGAYSAILKKNPQNYAAYAGRGLLYEQLKAKDAKELVQYKQLARKDYERALSLNDNQPEILNNLAALYIDEGKYDEAVLYLNRALFSSPNYVLAILNRAVARTKQERYSEALSDFSQAEKLEPYSPLLYLNRGLLEYAAGYYNSAITDFTALIGLEANNARAYLERGRTFVKMGYFQDAMEDFQKALALKPNYAMAYFYTAELLFNLGETDQGLFYAQRALNLAPAYAPAYEMLGDMNALESPVEATRHYLTARKLDPKNARRYQQKIRMMKSENTRKRVVFDRFANLEKR